MRHGRQRGAAQAPSLLVAAGLLCAPRALALPAQGCESEDAGLLQTSAGPRAASGAESLSQLAGPPGRSASLAGRDGTSLTGQHAVFAGLARAGASESTIGYLCCLISCLGFGSNYLFVKQVDVKDGMLFTLSLSFGVLCVGALQWLSSGMYAFEPFAMLGGTLWAIGNLCVPFIIQHCGLGIGQIVWSVTSMLTGWASGTFGFFGKEKDFVAYPSLNYAGVAMAVMSLGLFMLIKGTASENPEKEGLISGTSGRSAKFAMGFAVALVCGAFFGSNFNPPTYLQQIGQRDLLAGLTPRHSPHATDYVLSHFAGIFATTAAAFAVYAAATRGRVHLGREVVLPGIMAGVLWGIAQVAWFKANGVLSYVVAFPIIVGVPGLIAAMWGVVLFGENSGKRNLSVLGTVVVVQTVAVSLIAASKG